MKTEIGLLFKIGTKALQEFRKLQLPVQVDNKHGLLPLIWFSPNLGIEYTFGNNFNQQANGKLVTVKEK